MALPPLLPATAAFPTGIGSDFAALREEGIALAQAYSGAVWTDYNEHDPGVTILEAACYALTELGYRASFPVADILADSDGSPGSGTPILHRPSRILPSEPATLTDYRRLLLDRVEGLANAWLEPRFEGESPTGLYDMKLYERRAVPGLFERFLPDPRVEKRAERVFVRHRALCEDLASVRMLEPIRTVIGATVTIERSAWPEEMMAHIVQRLACWLAPEPRRRPLRELVDEGRPLGAIFEGPLALNGFIDPGDLGDPRRRVSAGEVDDQIVSLPGVLAVDDMALWVEPGRRGDTALHPHQYFSLDAGLDGKLLPIRLVAGGHECPVDGDEALRLLKRLWSEHRRTWRLGPECSRLFPMPEGRHRPLHSYAPISGLFPALYGIGGRSPGRDPPPARIAQTRQLEAYLALFDRLMTGYLDRLAGTRALLAAGPGDKLPEPRPLAELVPENLLAKEGTEESELFTLGQQDRLADFLLGLYGEEPVIPQPPHRAGGTDEESRRLAIKRALLDRLVAAGRGRGRGLDYRARRRSRRHLPGVELRGGSRRHLSGVELRSRIMLGAATHEGGRTRPRLSIVEHVLLRPRAPETGCVADLPAGEAMTVTAIVHLPWETEGLGSRRQVESMIRANTPAHIALRTFFVDREQWVRFRRLHRLWREALGDDMPEAIDCVSAELIRRFDLWATERQ
jgi:hypothetical protein